MKKLVLIAVMALLVAGCSKMEEKKPGSEKNPGQETENMQNPHGNMPPGSNQMNQGNMDVPPETSADPKADELSKGAYDFEANYKKDNNDAVKKQLVEKHMTAGNYLMFEANLSPKKKYYPALKHYRRILELDPSNAEAQRNKAQIEEIYTSMGRPIPND
jgi:Flp pilus assembly protein TadD